MSCMIIAIGNELVTGRVVNSNAAWIGHQLFQAGYTISAHLTLPDDPQEMERGIASALLQHDVVIVTGGLGPTCDDLTRPVIAHLLGRDIVQSLEVWHELSNRYGDHPVSIEDQCKIIEGASILKNRLGTAPGMYIRLQSSILVLLPGVPHEMQALVTEELLPLLKQELPPKKIFSSRFLHAFHVTETSVDPFLRTLQERYPELSCGIYPSAGVITVQIIAPETPQALSNLEEALNFLKSQLKDQWFESPNGLLEEAIFLKLSRNRQTISVAESCTGGFLSSRLTRLPGSSEIFLGGVVAYHNRIKESILGVNPIVLQKEGAVSEAVVRQMAEGILKLTQSDFSLAISGIAGPTGGTAEKPVGTVWVAIGIKDQSIKSKLFHFRGNREGIVARAANALMGEFLKEYCGRYPESN